MSENLDLVRSIYADWERGDFSSVEWAAAEIKCVRADGPDPAMWTGVASIQEAWREFLSAWKGYRVEACEYRELDSDRVLVLTQRRGRGQRSGIASGQLVAQGATVWHMRQGKVTRQVTYWDRDRALADLGLEE
jgi:ketosteroid isomerase-like protein